MKLVITKKASVAKSIASALSVIFRADCYFEGGQPAHFLMPRASGGAGGRGRLR